MSNKYLGLKKAQDLAGKRVRLVRATSNGLGSVPKGTTGTINEQHIRDGCISFIADKCQCCGFEWHVSGMRYRDFELLK